jgi:hypothetical protein
MELPNLNLPDYKFELKRKENKLYIKCLVRNRLFVLTPEEWVRQNFIAYLISDKNVPQSLIAVEKQINVNGLAKRFDILVYNTKGNPNVLIECKSYTVKVNQEVFNQVSVYNMALKVPYLIVTNGVNHYIARVSFLEKQVTFLKDIPSYNDL